MKEFLLALQFLTILPIKIRAHVTKKDLARSLMYFPLVGLLIGTLLAVIALIFGFMSPMVKAALILISSVVITGGIHLDGFADTCDGFYGSKPKEKILEIMRDSHIGVMGTVGIIAVLLLEFSIFSNLPPAVLAKALVGMAVFSRWSQLCACYVSDYARPEGKAECYIKYAGKKEILTGSVFTLAVFFMLLGLKGVVLSLLSLVPMFLFVGYAKKKIGGMTGDTIGAVNEIAEASILLLSIIFFS